MNYHLHNCYDKNSLQGLKTSMANKGDLTFESKGSEDFICF